LLFPAAALAPYFWPRLGPFWLPVSLYAGFCSGVLAHNQSHRPTFQGRAANAFYAAWLSVFYGYPTFAWVPIHNRNHHKYLNGPGDATITSRYSNANSWLVASTYFFVSSYFGGTETRAYIRAARARAPRLYLQIVLQHDLVAGAHATALAVAVLLYGWRQGALVYGTGFGAVAAMGLWGMAFINFIQHVHCDPSSEFDHSRNFVSRLGNYLVFNAGYHTAHHRHPSAHWSDLPALHARIAANIHPDLSVQSIFGFCFRSYVLGALVPRFRTRPIGQSPSGRPAPELAPRVA
jgi:fatty acid desaturase